MIANTVAWTANNIDGQYRRSLILGVVIVSPTAELAAVKYSLAFRAGVI